MPLSTRVARVGRDCVAGGTCLKVCPRGASRVVSGVAARVEESTCVGCGKCAEACPADVITVSKREGAV